MGSTHRGAGLVLSVALSAACASTSEPPQTRAAPFIDYETYASWDELSEHSVAVVVGEPQGSVSSREVIPGQAWDYAQQVRVTRVLKGPEPRAGEVVTVVRIGLSSASPRGGQPGHIVYGPLDPGQHVLFLREGTAPGSYAVAGHIQGDLRLRDGRVAGTEFPAFAGKTPDEIGQMLHD